jgi:hypothetical protein
MAKDNNIVAIDFETYYDNEYSLSNMSPYAYVHHKLFDPYMVSVFSRVNDISYVGRPEEFDWTILRGMTPGAHNASFDVWVYLRMVELDILPNTLVNSQWICSADMAAYLGMKRDLKSVCKYLLNREKSKAARTKAKGVSGDILAVDPEMLEYGMGDAVDCYDALMEGLPLWPERQRRIAHENRVTHMRGFTLDLDSVLSDIAALEPQRDDQLARIPWVWERDPDTGERLQDPGTGEYIRTLDSKGTPRKPLSAPELKAYGRSQGVAIPSSTAKTNPEFLSWLEENAEKVPWIGAIGKFRSLNTLTSRLYSLRDGYNPDTGRFVYEKKYYGAFTGRFSGGSNTAAGGKFNMENIPSKVMYGVNFRSVFIAKPGHILLIGDYDQIEARIRLWRVGETEALKPCFNGASVYQGYAEQVGIAAPGSDLKHENPGLYKLTKAQVLSAQYQVGAGAFQAQAKAVHGLDLTIEEAEAAVADFRRNNKKTVDYWAEHHDALRFSARRQDLTHEVELPSGRSLVYWNPRYFGNREIKAEQFRGEGYRKLYGGKLTENEMQALGWDILCDGWLAVADSEWDMPILLSVHDELVTEVPEDEADQRMIEMEKLMTRSSPWAEGLPIGAGIVKSKVYMKD